MADENIAGKLQNVVSVDRGIANGAQWVQFSYNLGNLHRALGRNRPGGGTAAVSVEQPRLETDDGPIPRRLY